MEDRNQTLTRVFHILGFSNLHQYQLILFIIILFAYLITVTGNLVIILIVRVEACLHSPMYLFISALSVLEIGYISTTVPKFLSLLLGANPVVSFSGCFAQVYVFQSLGISECTLFAMMAFDRYLAICQPLHYPTIMTNKLCVHLATLSFVVGFLAALLPTIFTARIPFCTANEINHFFCDLTPLLSLACTDIWINIIVNSSVSACAGILPLIVILSFYVNIIWAILKIKTTEGRKKAFSTCSSHLIVAGLFYGFAVAVYVIPKGRSAMVYDKWLALMYAVLTPMLNPFIYSLRNKDVKQAVTKHVKRLNNK